MAASNLEAQGDMASAAKLLNLLFFRNDPASHQE